MTQDELREYCLEHYIYNPETGTIAKKTSGKILRSKDMGGYLRMSFKGKYYKGHRIAYLMHYGELPNIIDHRNGNPFDNRISNLRGCAHAQNMRNRKQCGENNTTGFKGVYPSRPGKYCGQIYDKGQKKHLGTFDTAIEAAKAYNEAAIKYHGEFARLNVIS